MSALLREQIRIDILIKEVELRPLLYNREVPGYGDFNSKNRLWEEIAVNIFPQSWNQMSENQRDQAVIDVQKRWKNVRACFTRELRNQKYGDVKRRKYIYFDKLSFLLPCVDQFEITSRTDENEAEECKEEEEIDIKEEMINIPMNLPSYTRKRKVDSFDFIPESNLSKIDYDTNFALSLVPMLRAVPFCNKIDAQISILQFLKKYAHYDANTCTVDKIKSEFHYDSDS